MGFLLDNGCFVSCGVYGLCFRRRQCSFTVFVFREIGWGQENIKPTFIFLKTFRETIPQE